jgi:predicted metal-binding membrane protein
VAGAADRRVPAGTFGVGAHLIDGLLHRAAQAQDWLLFNGRALGVLVLTVAGLFQFSRSKFHCPDKCRTQLSFVTHHWGERTPHRDAFRLGLRLAPTASAAAGR